MKRKTNKRKGIFGKTETVVRTPKEKRAADENTEKELKRIGWKK